MYTGRVSEKKAVALDRRASRKERKLKRYREKRGDKAISWIGYLNYQSTDDLQGKGCYCPAT